MLQTITIQNFAIIEQLTVNFNDGMTVLTGETGAGKSIIIDALSLLTGGRATSDFIRYGSEKFILQALFDVQHLPQVQAFLKEESLYSDDEQLIITRELQQNGKGTVRINGILTTVAVLKRLGSLLIDIHGQHEHQHLMDETKHLALLDQFGDDTLQQILANYQDKYSHYAEVKQQLKKMLVSEQTDSQREQLLKRHLADIDEVAPFENEDVQLENELKALSNTKKSAETLSKLDYYLSHEEFSVKTFLNNALHENSAILSLANDYQEIDAQLNEVLVNVTDISKRVATLLDGMDFDGNRLDEISLRLEQLDKLKERYGASISDVLTYRQTIAQELDMILNKDKHLAKMQSTFLVAREEVLTVGKQLTQQRQIIAQQLEMTVKQQLKDLYMDKVDFSVAFKGNDDKIKIKHNGLDDVEFLVATNSGEPLKSLVKVASGGEVSRMMLALKAIFTVKQQIGTVVFDEIDTGVSGRVAQAIANKMYDIARNTQVLCISHLPQVAAKANYHLFVRKIEDNERTKTMVDTLTMAERRIEIARMFAGEEITELALGHADELLQH